MPVQASPRAVVAHGGAGVCGGGGVLHVAERDPGIEGRGDEGVAEGVRADLLAAPGNAGAIGQGKGFAAPGCS
jgi:hypothetical protein